MKQLYRVSIGSPECQSSIQKHKEDAFPSSRHTRGGVLIEVIVVLPLLFFIAVGIVDLSRMMIAHIATARMAYEGARFAASLIGLNAEVDGNGAKHQEVRKRVEELLLRYKYQLNDSARVNVEYRPQVNAVYVQVVTPYHAILPFFNWVTEIGSNATLPYLYPPEDPGDSGEGEG